MERGHQVFLYDDEGVVNIPFLEFRCDDSEHQPFKPLQDVFGEEPRYRGAHGRSLVLRWPFAYWKMEEVRWTCEWCVKLEIRVKISILKKRYPDENLKCCFSVAIAQTFQNILVLSSVLCSTYLALLVFAFRKKDNKWEPLPLKYPMKNLG